jgi:hypothetical protein
VSFYLLPGEEKVDLLPAAFVIGGKAVKEEIRVNHVGNIVPLKSK